MMISLQHGVRKRYEVLLFKIDAVLTLRTRDRFRTEKENDLHTQHKSFAHIKLTLRSQKNEARLENIGMGPDVRFLLRTVTRLQFLGKILTKKIKRFAHLFEKNLAKNFFPKSFRRQKIASHMRKDCSGHTAVCLISKFLPTGFELWRSVTAQVCSFWVGSRKLLHANFLQISCRLDLPRFCTDETFFWSEFLS